MGFFNDLIEVNKIAIKGTAKGIKKNWMIILSGFAYAIISLLVVFVVSTLLRGVFSILSGLVVILVFSSLISNYLTLVEVAVRGGKINFEIFKEGFKGYVYKVYGVFFFLYITSYLINLIGGLFRMDLSIILLLFNITVFILLNAIPEALYLTNYSPADTIKATLYFMKANWVQWAIPNILIFGLFYLLVGDFFSSAAFGGLALFSNPMGILRFVLNQVLLAIFMIYRGNLFMLLSNTPKYRIY